MNARSTVYEVYGCSVGKTTLDKAYHSEHEFFITEAEAYNFIALREEEDAQSKQFGADQARQRAKKARDKAAELHV